MSRTMILVAMLSVVGCQEYELVDPPTAAQLPPIPPTVYPPTESPPPAEALVYANTSEQFFEVNPTTGVRTLIGDFVDLDGTPVDEFFDIAIDNDGRVFGGTPEAIYQIDPETTQVTYRCPTGTVPVGMAFTPDGRLLVAGTDAISHLDLDTCIEDEVVENTPYQTSGDIVGLPDGFIYWTTAVSDFEDGLVRIDPDTWSLQYLGLIPVGDLFGVGYADDKLFGFSRYGDTVAIDPYASVVAGYVETNVLRNDTDISWWGATTNPVLWD